MVFNLRFDKKMQGVVGSSDRDSGGGGHCSADNSSHTAAPLMKLITDLRYLVIDVFESDRGSLAATVSNIA